MTELTDRLFSGTPRDSRGLRFRRWALLAAPAAAILFQVYVPLFLPFLAYLELPLLLTLYLALLRQNPLSGMFIGAAIGLVQDSLSHQPLGMFGIVKTLVGYFAGSVSLRFDVDLALVRLLLGFFFFAFHQFLYWVLARALLGQMVPFGVRQALVVGALNALVAVPLFHLLDKLKERS
jgi:rod shape-determining protein MreD